MVDFSKKNFKGYKIVDFLKMFSKGLSGTFFIFSKGLEGTFFEIFFEIVSNVDILKIFSKIK